MYTPPPPKNRHTQTKTCVQFMSPKFKDPPEPEIGKLLTAIIPTSKWYTAAVSMGTMDTWFYFDEMVGGERTHQVRWRRGRGFFYLYFSSH